jgi:glycogen operon protein
LPELDDIGEFRQMVDALHDVGIEVILDVAFNHTAEGGRLGPTFSFRGIDNLSYYRLQNENRRYYINDSGCGNTLNLGNPFVIQMVMDSLRYCVSITAMTVAAAFWTPCTRIQPCRQ